MQRQKLDLQQDARTGKLLFVENDATGEKTVPISADVDADGSVTATDLALVVDSAGATGVTRADVCGMCRGEEQERSCMRNVCAVTDMVRNDHCSTTA